MWNSRPSGSAMTDARILTITRSRCCERGNGLDQNSLTISPPLRQRKARWVVISIPSARKRTDPSPSSIDGYHRFHPEMDALKAVWDQGDRAIVQNVGYPNPDLLHFRSTEIWETGAGAH